MNPKMPTEYNIIDTLQEYYAAAVQKHALAVEIILKNPMSFHDHDAFYIAVETQLKKLMDAKDCISGLLTVQGIMEDNA